MVIMKECVRKEVDFRNVKAIHATGVPLVVMKDVEEFSAHDSGPIPDTQVLSAQTEEF